MAGGAIAQRGLRCTQEFGYYFSMPALLGPWDAARRDRQCFDQQSSHPRRSVLCRLRTGSAAKFWPVVAGHLTYRRDYMSFNLLLLATFGPCTRRSWYLRFPAASALL